MTTVSPPPEPDLRATVLAAALAYRAAGLSILPIETDGSKRPASSLLPRVPSPDGQPGRRSWRQYQQRIASEEEIYSWYASWGPVPGIAVIGGAISGNLEIIDFDSIDLAEPWIELVERRSPGLVIRPVIVATPRPGLHVYYRCSTIGGNRKLARQATTNPDSGRREPKTLVETKGEGGYCLVPPSPSWCHPSGRCYDFFSNTLRAVPTITPEERALLLDAATSFNTWHTEQPASPVRERAHRLHPLRPHLPGDDFNMRANWPALLVPHGWTLAYVDDGGVQHWRRPGKSCGTSATVDFAGSDLLHVFSSNAAPFEDGHSYSKFAAYALLEHAGDFTAAIRALRTRGFGSSPLPAGRRRRGRGLGPSAH